MFYYMYLICCVYFISCVRYFWGTIFIYILHPLGTIFSNVLNFLFAYFSYILLSLGTIFSCMLHFEVLYFLKYCIFWLLTLPRWTVPRKLAAGNGCPPHMTNHQLLTSPGITLHSQRASISKGLCKQ